MLNTQIAIDHKPCSTLEFSLPVLLSVSAILDTETTKKRQSISVSFWVIKFFNGWRESRISYIEWTLQVTIHVMVAAYWK